VCAHLPWLTSDAISRQNITMGYSLCLSLLLHRRGEYRFNLVLFLYIPLVWNVLIMFEDDGLMSSMAHGFHRTWKRHLRAVRWLIVFHRHHQPREWCIVFRRCSHMFLSRFIAVDELDLWRLCVKSNWSTHHNTYGLEREQLCVRLTCVCTASRYDWVGYVGYAYRFHSCSMPDYLKIRSRSQ
jgi:hypothetical protein